MTQDHHESRGDGAGAEDCGATCGGSRQGSEEVASGGRGPEVGFRARLTLDGSTQLDGRVWDARKQHGCRVPWPSQILIFSLFQ